MFKILLTGFSIGWVILLIAQPVSYANDSCSPENIGIRELDESGSKRIISIAKAVPLNDDEGSYAIAEAEARLEARRQLMKHLSPGLKNLRMSGLVDISLCRADGSVYATLEVDERNIVRAAKIQQLISDSIEENPTPQ